MDDFLPRNEHEEFSKRMEDEHKRTSRRLSNLEDSIRTIQKLTISVEKLAISMESMLEEQKSQGMRLQVLESRDGENWRTVAKYAITAIIGAALGFIFNKIGM